MNKNLIFILFVLFFKIEGMDLDQYACEIHSDKGSWGHNYLKYYQRYFDSFKDEPIRFLEIGFCVGLSALVWDKYFQHPNAELFYIDIDPVAYKYLDNLSQRVHFNLVDQSNEQLNNYISKVGPLDIIVDDGSHVTSHQIYSFKVLFPYLKSGGIYVIEDLFGSYWKSLGGGGTQDNPVPSSTCTVNYIHNLVHDLNYVAARNRYGNYEVCPDSIKQNLSYYQKEIEGIIFHSNICFIIKR